LIKKSRKGFTLVEIMVVLAILGIIVVGVLGLVTRQNKAYHSEEAIIDMQMSNRVAMDRFTHLVRMAGFGCQENISNGVNGLTTAITATNNNNAPDSLIIVSGLRKVGVIDDGDGTAGETLTTTVIPIGMDESRPLSDFFDDSNKQYFYISPAISKGFLTISSGGVDGTNKTLTKTGGNVTVNEGDNVYTVKAYTLAINSGNLTINENTGAGNQVYAENFEDLQFQYGWDANNNGAIDTSEWVDNPAGSEGQVRAVRIQILARSAQPDRDFFDLHDGDGATAGKQYIIADHSITLDTNEGNGFNSAFDHHYHRYLVETIVFIRNLNF
jgi:prepilin-type N-terminal cleavage/methylation domain-containing protein